VTLKLFVFSEAVDLDRRAGVDALAEVLKSEGLPTDDDIESRDLAEVSTPMDNTSDVGRSLLMDFRPKTLLSVVVASDGVPEPQKLNQRAEAAVPRARALITFHKVPLDGPAGAVSRVGLIRRNLEMTRAESFSYWTTRHAPMVIEQGPLFTRYSNNRVLDESSPVDGIVEQWFDTLDRLLEHDRQVAELKTDIRDDAQMFASGFRQFLATPSGGS
jgi:hypothetical protein